MSLLFSIPFVQTQIASYVTNKINDDFNVDLVIKKVDFSFLGSVQLKGVEIRDHHKDTLIFVKNLKTSLKNAKKVMDGEVKLKSISLSGADYHMKTYKGEKTDNMAVFMDSFKNNSPKDSTSKPFALEASSVYINNLNFKLINENKKKPLVFSAINTGGSLEQFSIIGPNVSLNTRGLYFKENRGLEVINLTTDFTYSLNAMHFKNTRLQTKNSDVKGNIDFTYKRENLSDFNNKVHLEADFSESTLSVQDLKKFYNELNGNNELNFTGKINGTLNNFTVKSLRLNSTRGLKIFGDFSFINSLNTKKGFVFDGNIKNLTTTYKELKNTLPKLLGKTLPTEFEKLGRFSLVGLIKVTPEQMNATVSLQSEIGSSVSDLQITNMDNIDTAEYNGEIELNNFDIGVFLNNPLFGEVSLKGDVNGGGFTLDNINTSFIGNISTFGFKGYNYQNITVNGQYQNNKFDGDLRIKDENFKMNFNGLADLSLEIHKFDFKSDITHLDLKKTNLFTRDSISMVKGNIELDMEGNTFDNIIGKATFNNIMYTNQKQEYVFKKFKVSSSLKDSIKTIEVQSKDIANGYVKGFFTFSELLPVAQNALGSMYTNFSPYEVAPNQFLDFNFTLYNQIVNVFFPSIYIDNKTKIKGKITSNTNQLKLTLSSPKIIAYNNTIENLLLDTNNKRDLYDTSIRASNVENPYYKVSKLLLYSKKVNDTLYFKSIFKGKKNKKQNFNLDFFYTFNTEGKSVVGFEESSFNFKENVWKIKPDKTNKNKVTFNLHKNEFDFSRFKFVSNEQEVEFTGSLKGDEEKVLLADFTKLNLESILPEIDSLALKGLVSGHLDFVQKKGDYSPEASLEIKDFQVNNFKQGDLKLFVKGENSYEKYAVSLALDNEKVKSIAATGSLDFSAERPLINLNVFLEDFGLDAFSPLGKDVLSSLRGTANGSFNLKGFLRNPDMSGTLRLNDAGLKFPFLNVDYDFEGESIITLEEQSFFLEGIKLKDTKNETRGKLNGRISHMDFKFWELDINISTENLLVLDTKDSEKALYYGTAFLDGNASITGLTDQLTIDVNGSTKPGTIFVVPLKDLQTVNSYKLIHFKSDNIAAKDRQKELAEEALKGLSLNINLEVTKDATARVVIDEVYGSQLSGNGTGNLDIRINTRGTFQMFGDYTIEKGFYDFKYGGIVNKAFDIQKGSTVSWSGSPYEANLNVTAIYKVKANPGVLLANFNSNRNIEIDLVTKISGGLFSSKQDLDIQLPNVDPSIANELEFLLNDNNENEKTKQFVNLLVFGSFVNPDRVRFGFDANNAITSTASNAIASAFSSLINNPDSKFQFDIGYKSGQTISDLDQPDADNQFDINLSTKVSDRVIINGKVGVPVGVKTQSSVVGEVKVEVLLNKEGNFRGVVFNRQNEVQYSAEEEGYTQGVGLSFQVNFNSLSDLLSKISLKKKKSKTFKKTIQKDSIKSKRKELVNFKGN
jgi:hypothetical protein